MAGINPYRPVDTREKESDLDKVAKGLLIAEKVYGIVDASKKAELLKQTTAREQQALQVKQAQEDAKMSADGYEKQTDEKGAVTYLRPPGYKSMADKETEAKINEANARAEYYRKYAGRGRGGVAGDDGKTIPANDAVAMGGSGAAFDALEAAKEMFSSNEDISGPFAGRVASVAGSLEIGKTGKRFKTYDAQLKANAQTIGRYLEGGKLTDEDIERYKQMLPNHLDSPDVAEEKAVVLQNLIAKKQNSELNTLQQAGYATSNIPRMEMQPNPNLRINKGGSVNVLSVPKAQADSPVVVSAPPQGMVAVSNGKETLYIPAADEKSALRDGYKRVK